MKTQFNRKERRDLKGNIVAKLRLALRSLRALRLRAYLICGEIKLLNRNRRKVRKEIRYSDTPRFHGMKSS